MTDTLPLARAFLAGALDLRRAESLLNRINVFPVVDADTGINMCHTLSSTVAKLTKSLPTDLNEFAKTVTRSVVRDAKGNSGVIFSQFLSAFFKIFEDINELSLGAFAMAVSSGREAAYKSVNDPVEGTLLTVICDLDRILNGLVSIHGSKYQLTIADHTELENGLAKSVANTPDLLPKLKDAGVVDSGALGFYIFASGLTLALPAVGFEDTALQKIESRISAGESAPLTNISDTIEPKFLESTKDDSQYRYCLNMLVELPQGSKQDWSAPFEKLGASIDAAVSGNLLKLHVHTNNIEDAKTTASSLGKLVNWESDDMSEGLVKTMMSRGDLSKEKIPLRVVGDSSMSIALETENELDIYKLENYVNVHGQMVTANELDRDKLFTRMTSGATFTTAQASPVEANDFIGRMLSISDHLVFFAVGGAYSGTQAMVRKQVENSGRVTVIDTHAASAQQGLACIAAARFAKKAPSIEDLIEYSKRQVESCTEYIVIDDLKFLARSGRIGKVKAAFAGILAVKPIVGHGNNGAITHGKVRSHDAALNEICKRVKEHPGEGQLLVMVEYTDNREWTGEVAARLQSELGPECEIIEAPLSPTSAVHMGPGTWGVAVTRI